MQLKFIGDYIMPMLRIGVPGPIAAMMREVDGLRLQDRDTVKWNFSCCNIVVI